MNLIEAEMVRAPRLPSGHSGFTRRVSFIVVWQGYVNPHSLCKDLMRLRVR